MSSNTQAVRASIILTIGIMSALTTVFIKTIILASACAGRLFNERKLK